jgi:hypothetical protein
MNTALPDASVLDQIAAVTLKPDQPLIICDADEVLFAFMAAFEAYLNDGGHYFDWSSFALTGNIRRHSDSEPLEGPEVMQLLGRFFDACTASMDPVPGAAKTLQQLNRRAQIVVLSNLPATQAPARREALVRHGMDYPLVANSGPKGPAVAQLTAALTAPVFFIDDGPNHHKSVAEHAAEVRRLHMVADDRLAKLIAPAPHSHHRTDDWTSVATVIESELAALGF